MDFFILFGVMFLVMTVIKPPVRNESGDDIT